MAVKCKYCLTETGTVSAIVICRDELPHTKLKPIAITPIRPRALFSAKFASLSHLPQYAPSPSPNPPDRIRKEVVERESWLRRSSKFLLLLRGFV